MPAKTLSNHLKSEELQRLTSAWPYLSPWQRKVIRLKLSLLALPQRSLLAFETHLLRRRARFAYLYRAHWV